MMLKKISYSFCKVYGLHGLYFFTFTILVLPDSIRSSQKFQNNKCVYTEKYLGQ